MQAKPADRKVRPKPSPKRDQDIIARIDPELDDIRYGECDHPGKSVSDIQGLNVALSDKFQVQFMEDNQATITIILKGDSQNIKHTDRTQRTSFGWLKQQFERKLFNRINVGTKEQVADIFTKPFADKSKWEHAMKLINHVRVETKLKPGGKDSDAHVVSKPHLTAAASTPTRRSTDQAEDLATRLIQKQDFSDTALNNSIKFYSRRLRPGQVQHHLTKATLKYPSTTIFLNRCVAARSNHNWTRLVIKTKNLTPNDDASSEVYRTTTGTVVRLLSMNHDSLTSKEHQALLPLSFRTDDTHFAAPARTRPRPLDACNRVIVEFCCGEDSKLGEKRNASKGCYIIRMTAKDDATKQSTINRLCKDLRPLLCDEGRYTAKSRPLLICASLPCMGGCSWQHINILTNREKVEDHHKLFLKLLKSLKSSMRVMKPLKPELAMELPKTCDYWKWTVVQAFIKKHCLQSCLCDGCMLGIVDDDGRPLRKSWQIMYTLLLPGLNGRTCDGTHEHGQSRGHSHKDAESYSYHVTDAIHRDWKQHVAKTTERIISQRKSFALCCLAGSNPTPATRMATSAERTRAFWWQDIMWGAVLSEEFQAGCGDDEFEKADRPFYANVNPQTALAASIDHLRLPGLSRLSTIANAGLSEIQPGKSRPCALPSSGHRLLLGFLGRQAHWG